MTSAEWIAKTQEHRVYRTYHTSESGLEQICSLTDKNDTWKCTTYPCSSKFVFCNPNVYVRCDAYAYTREQHLFSSGAHLFADHVYLVVNGQTVLGSWKPKTRHGRLRKELRTRPQH